MTRIPDMIIERVHLGEATADQKARVMADPDAALRLAELDAENAAFLDAHPSRATVGEIQRRLHQQRTRDAVARRRTLTRLGLLIVPVAAAMLLVLGLPSGDAGRGAGPSDGPGLERPKGQDGSKIYLYRRVNGQPRSLSPGTVLLAGDQLQIGYRRGQATHGVVVSIDGRGAVTLHSPDDRDTTLRGTGRVLLPHAYELDDAPDFERFVFVTGGDPIDVDAVVQAAESVAATVDARTARLDLPQSLRQQDFTVLKEVP